VRSVENIFTNYTAKQPGQALFQTYL